MRELTHIAQFSPVDEPSQILLDLACPACGHQDPGDLRQRVSDNKLRIFCDCCGAFTTVLLSDEQAVAVRRWSENRSAISDHPSSEAP